jgi:spoIIIJ-associated protein
MGRRNTYEHGPWGPAQEDDDVAGQRGGRRRAPKGDAFRDALVGLLADALDVERSQLEVSVLLDGAPVRVGQVPVELVLEVTADEESAEGPAAEAEEVEEVEASESGPSRGASVEVDSGPAPVASRNGSRAERAAVELRDSAPLSAQDLDEEAEAAADLLEGLLDAMDLPGDLRISVQEAHAEVEVVGLEEGVLIGRRGQTLDAVQELVRTAMQRRFERRSRVLVDVDGYRARRLEKLVERADEAVAEVLATGEPQRLEPMDSIERRIVHQRIAEHAGVVSNSHGREPSRRIVIELVD